MAATSCHPNCGCNVTDYKGCCLECPLKECYYVPVRKLPVPTPFRIKMRERTKRIKDLCSQGLRPAQIALVTGESSAIIRRLRYLPDDQ